MSRHRRRQAYRRRRRARLVYSRVASLGGTGFRADAFVSDGERVVAFVAVRPGFKIGDKPRNSSEARLLQRLIYDEINGGPT